MNGKAKCVRRTAAWVMGSLLCCLTVTGCSTTTVDASPGRKPRPEIFDQEVVKITVDYERESIRVEPESVKIYFQWTEKHKDPLRPVQARWVVKGLRKNHVVHIVSKEEKPKVRFPFPRRYRGRPSYAIDGKNNSIVSGEVQELPDLKKNEGYTDRRRDRYDDGDPYEEVWRYDVVVTNRRGQELFRIDPEIVVAGHP